LLAAIERLINRRIEQKIIPGFEPGTGSHAPAQRHEPQRHQRGRQGAGQSHHRNGGNGQQRRRQERREEPGSPARGQQQRHGQPAQRPQARHAHAQQPQRHPTQQAAPLRQHAKDEDRQPSPERAATQSFPGFLGGIGHRIFGRKPS